MKTFILVILIAASAIAVGVTSYAIFSSYINKETEQSPMPPTPKLETNTTTTEPLTQSVNGNMKHLITLKTNLGSFQFLTYDADAPNTVENFIRLVGKGFYNNLTFHRVVKDFVIQGGDPYCSSTKTQNLCGTGGPGYKFDDELDPATQSYKEGYERGVVAMANSGPNTNGSQFFIMIQNVPLPHNYTIFGKVIKGQDIVDKIGNLPTGTNDRPLSPVIINNVSVENLTSSTPITP